MKANGISSVSFLVGKGSDLDTLNPQSSLKKNICLA